MPSKHSSGFGMVRALRLRSRGGRAGWFGGVISAGWSSAGRWSAGRWSAGVEDLQAERVAGRERVVGRASCRGSELFWWSHFCRLLSRPLCLSSYYEGPPYPKSDTQLRLNCWEMVCWKMVCWSRRSAGRARRRERESCRESELQGERVVLVESLL